MKKVNLLFLAALAVILLAGCKDEPENQLLYKVGDYYPDPNAVYSDGELQLGTAAIGIVFWLNTDAPGYDAATKSGVSGKIVSLDEASDNLTWGPVEVETGTTSCFDGLANMSVIKELDNTFSAYPAFAWVDQKNGAAGATAYASGTKGIWYLPAVAELQYLVCAAAGEPCETWSFPDSDNDSSQNPSFNPIRVVIDLSGLDDKLTSAGGVPLTAYSYWSSIEYNAYVAWLVSFIDGRADYNFKTTTKRVRCVMEF